MNPDECIPVDAYSTDVSDWRIRKEKGRSLTGPGFGHEAMWTVTSSGCRVTRTAGALRSETKNVHWCTVWYGWGSSSAASRSTPRVLGLISSHPSFPHLQPAILAPPRGRTISKIMEPQPSFRSCARPRPGHHKSGISRLRNQQSATTKQSPSIPSPRHKIQDMYEDLKYVVSYQLCRRAIKGIISDI